MRGGGPDIPEAKFPMVKGDQTSRKGQMYFRSPEKRSLEDQGNIESPAKRREVEKGKAQVQTTLDTERTPEPGEKKGSHGACQKNKGMGRPKTGRRTGRHGLWTPDAKKNSRPEGQVVLRRDLGAAARVRICLAFEKEGIKGDQDWDKVPQSFWNQICRKYNRTREFLKKTFQRREEYKRIMIQLRLGQHSIRPFGSRLPHEKKASESLGARLPSVKDDQTKGSPNIPCRGVFHKLKQWVEVERSKRHEVRPTTLVTRFRLELARELAIQETLEREGSKNFQKFVKEAVSHRLAQYANPSFDKKKFNQDTLFPNVGARPRRGAKLHESKMTDRRLCELQWGTCDRAIWLVAYGTAEDLQIMVKDTFNNPSV